MGVGLKARAVVAGQVLGQAGSLGPQETVWSLGLQGLAWFWGGLKA